MPSSAPDNAIMTLGDAADNLKATERTIYRQAGASKIRTHKVGGWWLSKAEIDQWIKKQSMGAVDTGSEFFDQATRRTQR